MLVSLEMYCRRLSCVKVNEEEKSTHLSLVVSSNVKVGLLVVGGMDWKGINISSSIETVHR